MLNLDRTLPTPVHNQLADQLRFEIADGRYRVGDALPSTRDLAANLGISFHTVRKVYQELEREGFLVARRGSGYIVKERGPLGKEARMERGATVARDALVRMKSLGLNESEIDYLFQEQGSLLESSREALKLIVALPYSEMAEHCATVIESALQINVYPAPLSALDSHADADAVLVAYPDIQHALRRVSGADIVGLNLSLKSTVLDDVARLPQDAAIALVVRDDDAVRPLMNEIRTATGYSGEIVAVSVAESHETLSERMAAADVTLATPACRRKVRGVMKSGQRFLLAEHVIAPESISRIAELLPR